MVEGWLRAQECARATRGGGSDVGRRRDALEERGRQTLRLSRFEREGGLEGVARRAHAAGEILEVPRLAREITASASRSASS